MGRHFYLALELFIPCLHAYTRHFWIALIQFSSNAILAGTENKSFDIIKD